MDEIEEDEEAFEGTEETEENDQEEIDSDGEDDDDETDIVMQSKDKSSYSKIRYIKTVPKEDRRSSHIMQTYEYARVIAVRAKQISNGSTFSELKSDDPIELAKDEVKNGRCPLKIRRKIAVDTYEVWDVNELLVML